MPSQPNTQYSAQTEIKLFGTLPEIPQDSDPEGNNYLTTLSGRRIPLTQKTSAWEALKIAERYRILVNRAGENCVAAQAVGAAPALRMWQTYQMGLVQRCGMALAITGALYDYHKMSITDLPENIARSGGGFDGIRDPRTGRMTTVFQTPQDWITHGKDQADKATKWLKDNIPTTSQTVDKTPVRAGVGMSGVHPPQMGFFPLIIPAIAKLVAVIGVPAFCALTGIAIVSGVAGISYVVNSVGKYTVNGLFLAIGKDLAGHEQALRQLDEVHKDRMKAINEIADPEMRIAALNDEAARIAGEIAGAHDTINPAGVGSMVRVALFGAVALGGLYLWSNSRKAST